jgi:hypothetical protein
MQPAIVSSKAAAITAASASGAPAARRKPPRASGPAPSVAAIRSSPRPGVCHTCAMSCQT